MRAYGYLFEAKKFSFDDEEDDRNGKLHIILANGIEITGTVWNPRIIVHDLSVNHDQAMEQLLDIAETIVEEKIEMTNYSKKGTAFVIDRIFSVADSLDESTSHATVMDEIRKHYPKGRSLNAGAPRAFIAQIELDREVNPIRSRIPGAVEMDDGRSYIPRKIMNMQDLAFMRQARDNHMPVLLSAEPGTGKTTMLEAAFGNELVTLNCFEQMQVADLVGQWKPDQENPNQFVWVDGPLVSAMIEGRPLLIDDATWMPNSVQSILLPVMDHRRRITVIDRPGQTDIAAAPGFTVVLSINPGTGFGIIDPLRSRVAAQVEVPMDLTVARQLNIDPQLLDIAETLMEHKTQDTRGAQEHWVPSLRSLLKCTELARVFEPRIGAAALRQECTSADADLQDRVDTVFSETFGQNLPNGLTAHA